MEVLLTVLLFLLALFLIVLVIAQPDRSNGMSASIGGGASNTIFGVNEDGGPIAKLTRYIAIAFLVVAFVLYLVSK